MVVEVIYKKLKSLLLIFVTLFKRALCCLRRRRRSSEFAPLTQIGVISNQNIQISDVENWGDWNEPVSVKALKPSSIQEHIEFYRQQTIASRQVQEELSEVPENFFEDMTPIITKQKKLFINKRKEDNNSTNRLSLVPEDIAVVGQELGEWDDNGKGWEDQVLDLDARAALKESRKQARQKKLWEQQQQKQEKFTRLSLGAKVSS